MNKLPVGFEIDDSLVESRSLIGIRLRLGEHTMQRWCSCSEADQLATEIQRVIHRVSHSTQERWSMDSSCGLPEGALTFAHLTGVGFAGVHGSAGRPLVTLTLKHGEDADGQSTGVGQVMTADQALALGNALLEQAAMARTMAEEFTHGRKIDP